MYKVQNKTVLAWFFSIGLGVYSYISFDSEKSDYYRKKDIIYVVLSIIIFVVSSYKLLIKKPTSQKQLSEDVFVCSNCGWEVAGGATNCSHCNHIFEERKYSIESHHKKKEKHHKEKKKLIEEIFCSTCNSRVLADTQVCPTCGEKFESGKILNINNMNEEKLIEQHFPCPDCGTIILENQTECQKCGRFFAGKEKPVEEEEEKFYECSECGEGVSEFDAVCPKCGISLVEEEVECSDCGASIPKSSTECPKCGAKFTLSIFKCPDCGNEILEQETECPFCCCNFEGTESVEEKKTGEEFECSDCGGIVSERDTICPHCQSVLTEDELGEKTNSSVKEIKNGERNTGENDLKNKITIPPPAQNSIYNFELKLFERSELKNIFREILKSKEEVIPHQLVSEKNSLEQIFKQLENGTYLMLTQEEVETLQKVFSSLQTQPSFNSTLKSLQEKFCTFTPEKNNER